MKKVSIGMLLPSSSILPMAKDFEIGLKKGLRELAEEPEWEINLIPEFIGQGGKEKMEAALSKLISYDNADIIAGVISNKSVQELNERLSKISRPVLVSNLGEHLPAPEANKPGIFINSVNLWQQVWSLGYWGAREFGPVGMFVSGLYDAGYSFSSMLHLGMTAARPDARMPFAVAPVTVPGRLADIDSVYRHIDQFNPDFVFAAFCGEEASLFLEGYIKRGYHKRTALLGFPYLLQPFSEVGEITIYTSFSTLAPIQEGQQENAVAAASNPFPLLGYEAGRIIAQALVTENQGTFVENVDLAEAVSERGRVKASSGKTGEHTHVYLVANHYNGDPTALKSAVGNQLPTINSRNEELNELMQNLSSGWTNPYLSV